VAKMFPCLLLLAVPALALPPEIDGYVRLDTLRDQLRDRTEELRKKEEYERKPREEKMIIKFAEGEKKFEGKKLSGDVLVKEVLDRWDASEKDTPDQETLRVLNLLPNTLKAAYGKFPIPKAERYKAGYALVKLLNDKRLHVRSIAFECLQAIYGESLQYNPNADKSARAEKQKAWERNVKNKRK